MIFEIPKFDLAKEIMAEHRKITAIRRKGPGKKKQIQKARLEIRPKFELEIKSAGLVGARPIEAVPGQKKIIAEIVARDIEQLCMGEGFDYVNHV